MIHTLRCVHLSEELLKSRQVFTTKQPTWGYTVQSLATKNKVMPNSGMPFGGTNFAALIDNLTI
jgi:hypothetical protein